MTYLLEIDTAGAWHLRGAGIDIELFHHGDQVAVEISDADDGRISLHLTVEQYRDLVTRLVSFLEDK